MSRPERDPEDRARRLRGVELLVLDVDGVMTDGRITLDDHGVETKSFYVRDGSAIDLWRRAGRRVAIISGRAAPVVSRRAAELGIAPVVQGARDKRRALMDLCGRLGIDASRACCVGDDLPDLPAMQSAGVSACPADAETEVRAAADVVAPSPGGRGAVRDIIRVLLEAQELWRPLLAEFQGPDGEPVTFTNGHANGRR